jgi:hypothetical protein
MIRAYRQKHKKPLGATGPSSTLGGSQESPHPRVALLFSTSLPRFKAFLDHSGHKATDLACS